MKEIKITIHEGESLHVFANYVSAQDVMIMMGSALGEFADEFSKNDAFNRESFFNAVTDMASLPRPLREVTYNIVRGEDND